MTAKFSSLMQEMRRGRWMRCAVCVCWMVFSFVMNTIFVDAAESEVGVSVEPQLTQEVTQPSHLGGSPALPQCLRLTDLRCFDDRPDLILIGSDSDYALDGDTQPSSRVSVIELRDEQDLTNASPNAREQAAVYTLRIASPDLLLDESSVVQLQGSADSADENDKDRIFAPLANRLVCQNEFPRRDHNSNEIVIYISINR